MSLGISVRARFRESQVNYWHTYERGLDLLILERVTINLRCATNTSSVRLHCHSPFLPFIMSPTILAVPGAWHTVESFEPIKKIFTEKGYRFVSQNAPGLHDANATCQDDAESLRTKLLHPLIEDGKDIVVLMHSYGGMYGSQAVRGLSKKEQEQAGKKGGVIALIYVSAVTPVEGKTTLDMMGTDAKNLPPWVEYNVRDSTSPPCAAGQPHRLTSSNHHRRQRAGSNSQGQKKQCITTSPTQKQSIICHC